MFKSIYYPPYDISVDKETGEIPLPICKCKEEDACIFMNNWIQDGKPTHVPKEELEELISKEDQIGDLDFF